MKRRTLHEQAEYVRSAIEGMGLNINPSSRVGRMLNAICGPDGQPRGPILRDDKKTFLVVREALRDLQLLCFIFDELAVSGKVQKMVRRVMKDSVLPQADTERSPGRDTQFELFVGAVANAAGLHPRFEEPDVVGTVGTLEFGIAAKRVKSIARVDDRVSEGARQIQDSGRPGIIAMDVSFAMNPDNVELTRPVAPEELKRAANKTRDWFRGEFESKILEATRGKEVRGVAIHDHIVVCEPDGIWTLSAFYFPIPCAVMNQRRNREFGAIYDTYLRGLPNRGAY